MAIVRTYRRDEDGTLNFREAWFSEYEGEELGQFVVNHGVVGHQSETETAKDVTAAIAAGLLDAFIEQCEADGFKTLTEADLAGVEVVVAEVYPSLYKAQPQPGEVKDQAQVRVTAEHFARLDETGKLGAAFTIGKTAAADVVLDAETEEGWILGVEA